jgi:hypothetical protein
MNHGTGSVQGKRKALSWKGTYVRKGMLGNRYNSNRENPGPPVILELWDFALKHYLNLGVKSNTF